MTEDEILDFAPRSPFAPLIVTTKRRRGRRSRPLRRTSGEFCATPAGALRDVSQLSRKRITTMPSLAKADRGEE
jgi:hypothetical protein